MHRGRDNKAKAQTIFHESGDIKTSTTFLRHIQFPTVKQNECKMCGHFIKQSSIFKTDMVDSYAQGFYNSQS